MQVNGRKVVSNLKIGQLCAIIASVFVLVFCCFTFTACDPIRTTFKQEDLSDIVSIELINYDNHQQKKFATWVTDHSSELKPFDESKASVLEALDVDKTQQFIDSLCEYSIFLNYYKLDSPNGICIKLTYSNGDFLIINNQLNSGKLGKHGYIGRFSPNGEVAEFIGAFSTSNYFELLVTDFFQYNI